MRRLAALVLLSVVALATCSLVERLGLVQERQVPSGFAGVWQDRDGRPVPDGSDPAKGMMLVTFDGAAHCDTLQRSGAARARRNGSMSRLDCTVGTILRRADLRPARSCGLESLRCGRVGRPGVRGRGRPPQAAARRLALRWVEESLTGSTSQRTAAGLIQPRPLPVPERHAAHWQQPSWRGRCARSAPR